MERDNPACGVRTTGEVVDGSSGVIPLTVGQGVVPLTVGQGVVPLTVTTPAYIKPALGHGASGIENVTCGACGRPDRVLTAALADRDATIAEQAAEIERLKKNYEDAAGAFVIARESSATRHLAAQQMIAEQNELRTEIERLIRVHGEQMETIAALEAERDALCDELDAANARAEKYFAVIKAKDAEILALGQAWTASMATGQAMQEAGIQFRHVSQDIPPFVAEETE
jgi:hypothetical protein